MNALKSVFAFCPRCSVAEPRIRSEREVVCPSCGLRFFFNTAAAAGCFLFQEDQLVLCVRANEPGLGLLDVPGGFIEFGETVEEGLRREVLEELGVEIGELEYLTSQPNDYPFGEVPYRTLDLFFTAKVLPDAVLTPQDDVSEIFYCSILELEPERFAFQSTRKAFLKLLEK